MPAASIGGEDTTKDQVFKRKKLRFHLIQMRTRFLYLPLFFWAPDFQNKENYALYTTCIWLYRLIYQYIDLLFTFQYIHEKLNLFM